MKKNMLEISNFSCGYGSAFRINNININIPKGSFAGIIGPNGSGKTTLFRGISSELKALSGSIIVNGKDIQKLQYKEKAQNIAVVSQSNEPIDMEVEDYVLMGRIPYQKRLQFFESKTDITIARKYMELTKIDLFKNKLMNELSGGEQQLANIARALTQEPNLLLLDEPTSHLDISHQVQVLNLIQQLNKSLGLTVLMNIHDLNLAGEYCDYLIMLDSGRIHTQGSPEKVLSYKNIEKVYNTVVVTETNPISKKPVIFLVSEQLLKQNESLRNLHKDAN